MRLGAERNTLKVWTTCLQALSRKRALRQTALTPCLWNAMRFNQFSASEFCGCNREKNSVAVEHLHILLKTVARDANAATDMRGAVHAFGIARNCTSRESTIKLAGWRGIPERQCSISWSCSKNKVQDKTCGLEACKLWTRVNCSSGCERQWIVQLALNGNQTDAVKHTNALLESLNTGTLLLKNSCSGVKTRRLWLWRAGQWWNRYNAIRLLLSTTQNRRSSTTTKELEIFCLAVNNCRQPEIDAITKTRR